MRKVKRLSSFHYPINKMNNTYLEINSVTKKFDKTIALNDVNIDIKEGEFIFLLGPSGCGKTTLLRIIAGLEELDKGNIILSGTDITMKPASMRDFGIVFQSYALFPNLKVSQNISYGLINRREEKENIRKRVSELLDLMGLEGLGDRYPTQLSGGQQQRVALARALAINPKLLLLDEPLSALDARVRGNLRIEIARLQRQLGITTIMVSHDQEEALTMADRVVVLDEGRIIQVGKPQEIYFNPVSPFVADFVGLMNFLPGKVLSKQDNQVKVGNHVLTVDLDITQANNSDILLAIRPEEIHLQDKNEMHNTLQLFVEEVEFIGPFYKLHLGFQNQTRIVTYLPPENSTNKVISEGENISIQLPAAYLRVYDPVYIKS